MLSKEKPDPGSEDSAAPKQIFSHESLRPSPKGPMTIYSSNCTPEKRENPNISQVTKYKMQETQHYLVPLLDTKQKER